MKTALYLILVLGLHAVFGADADTPTSQTVPYQAKVVDANGQPIPGALVERYEDSDWLTGGGTSPRLAARVTADDQGAAKFTNNNRMTFTLVASKPGLSFAWGTVYPQFNLDQEPLELTLTAPVSVSGIIQDAGGKPLANAEVWVSAAYHKGRRTALVQAWSLLNSALGRQFLSTRTTAEGKFRLDRLPEDTTLDLAATSPGLALGQQTPSFFAGSPNLSFQSGQSNIVLTLHPAGIIEGQVVEEETGTPVAGAIIQPIGMGSANNLRAGSPTGPDGRFRLADVAAGEYSLRATIGTNAFPDWVCDTVATTVEVGATNRDVKFTATRGSVLEVTVRDPQGRPIKDAGVTAASQLGGQSAQTTDQGVARLRLVPGPYVVIGSKPGLSGEQSPTTCERGQTNRLEISLEPTPRFAGAVLDPQGKPAPKVTVVLFPFQQGQVLTDAEGHFSLAPNANRFGGGQNVQRVVVARDPDHNLAAAIEVEDTATNVTARLEPGLTLAGRVTGVDGKAITNAELSLMFHTERFGTQLGAPVGVDAQGRFEIKGLPTGRRYGVTASAKGFGSGSRNLETPEATTRRIEVETFELTVADRRIAGIVIDENDKPVAGAMLYSNGEGQPNLNGRTDAKGRFSFDQVCAGPINLSANSPRGQAYGSVQAEGGDTNITIQLGVQQNFPNVAGAGGKSKLVGSVVDPEGKPAPKVTVSLFPYSQGEKQTDAEGRFTLTSDPNQFIGMQNVQRIVIARDLARNLATTADLDEDTTNVALKLEPGLTLAGRVTDAQGKAIAKAEAHLIMMAGNMGSSFGTPAHTDTEGRFEIKGLPPGRHYSVNIIAKGYGTDNRNVEPGDTATRRIDLDPFQLTLADQRIAGVVVDDEDKPVKGAQIYTYGTGQPNVNGQTDAKGRFSFDHVCAGPINISAHNPRGGNSGSIVAEGGDTNITVKLGVNQRMGGMAGASSKITGTILDPDGKPAPKVQVSLFPDPQDGKPTDAEGHFKLTFDPNRFGGMQINQRVVIARDLIRNLAVALDLEDGATNADLKLEPAWSLAGRAVDPNGAAIRGAQAELMFKTERMMDSYGPPTRADAEGRFEIKGLPNGRSFSVRISAPGYGQDTPNVEPPEGDTRRVELDPTQLLPADQRIAGVVLDADDKPVAGAYINGSGNKHPYVNGQTDSKGRFSFKQVCAGQLRIFVNSQQGLFGNANVEGGDTNITIRITANRAGGGRTPPAPVASLEGKPLPDLAPLGLAGDDVPAKKPLLALLIDAEQRPSRRVLKRMTELADTLKEKGVAVIILQAGAMEGEALETWKKENALPFPVGLFKGNRDKARAAWGAAALPWLILTDPDHKVTAEGFAIGELDEKLKPTDK